MNCRTARQLIHLDRPGERTDHETANLNEHLRRCPDCSAEVSKLGTFGELELRIRSATVPVPDLSDVKARVLAATIRPAPRWTLGQRAPRFAYALAVVATLAWFAGEQWQIRASHAALVERLEDPSKHTAGPEIVYTVDAKEVRKIAARKGPILAEIPAEGSFEIPQATATIWIEQAPAYLVRSLVRHPGRQAQVADALKSLQSVIDVTIRYRSKGA